MERSKFEALVKQSVNRLPRAFREKLINVAIIVEDLAPASRPPVPASVVGRFRSSSSVACRCLSFASSLRGRSVTSLSRSSSLIIEKGHETEIHVELLVAVEQC